jgi:gamma-glutamylcyclotransferase
MLNFSYGSNLLCRRMTQRVPSARSVQTAVLRGYELRWHKMGQDGSAKCDIVPSASPDSLVHGVVYELAVAEKLLLDAAEGLGHGYEEMQVVLQAASGGSIEAWTYYATDKDAALQPFSWYKALVVAGALEHRLPTDYIDRLQAVPAVQDPDTRRADLHWVLASQLDTLR